MFERRLRILLIVMFSLLTVLLARAAQIQVLSKGEWEQEAAQLSRRKDLTETTRGKILDFRGNVIAVDEPCIDAWVEFGAISRNDEVRARWVKDVALRRLATRQPGVYRKASTKDRETILAAAEAEVLADLDEMWRTLARETNKPFEEIEETRLAIDQRVLMRERYIQYRNFEEASGKKPALKTTTGSTQSIKKPRATTTTVAAAATQPAGPASSTAAAPTTKPSWLQRFLMAGASDEIEVDHFEFESEQQKQAHAIVRNITPESYTRLAKDIDNLPGLVLKQGVVRRYPHGKAGAHLLGHLGVVVKKDLDSPENPKNDDLREYQPTDLIGRGGLEQLAEPSLRGTRGYVQYPAGRKDEIVATQKALPGRDVRTTIDIDLQAQLQGFFEHAKIESNLSIDDKRTVEVAMHGAAVVIDIRTSEVRAMASYPDFDPNDMVDHYAQLATQYLDAPLMNRATQTALEPGSTVKPVVGLGAITDHFIEVTKGIECTGYLVIGNKRQQHGKCWTASFINDPRVGPSGIAHHQMPVPHKGVFGNADGSLCFADALERSCNVYFETVADTMGPDKLAYWFDRFGLGHETGVGISEARGQIPGPEARRNASLTWFSAIGQTTMRATPIQMANVVATIARNGIWMKPRLVASDQKDIKLAPIPLRDGRVLPDQMDLKLDHDAVLAAHEGMRRVVNNPPVGTGEAARMDEIVVAGKTGTAQGQKQWVLDKNGDPVKLPGEDGVMGTSDDVNVELEVATFDHPTNTPWYRGWGADGHLRNHSWFVCYAPAENPQVAIAVMVEYGGSGGHAAGAIIKKSLMACAEHGYLKLAR